MKSNFISFLTLIKSMVTAVKIVLFNIHQQNDHFTTGFRKKFLTNGFQYNKKSLLFKNLHVTYKLFS